MCYSSCSVNVLVLSCNIKFNLVLNVGVKFFFIVRQDWLIVRSVNTLGISCAQTWGRQLIYYPSLSLSLSLAVLTPVVRQGCWLSGRWQQIGKDWCWWDAACVDNSTGSGQVQVAWEWAPSWSTASTSSTTTGQLMMLMMIIKSCYASHHAMRQSTIAGHPFNGPSPFPVCSLLCVSDIFRHQWISRVDIYQLSASSARAVSVVVMWLNGASYS